MLKLDFGGPARNLEFLNGEITVGGSVYRIELCDFFEGRNDHRRRGLERDVQPRRERTTWSASRVNKGTATLTKADGSTQTVSENQALEVSMADGTSHFVSRPDSAAFSRAKPARNARISRTRPALPAAAQPAQKAALCAMAVRVEARCGGVGHSERQLVQTPTARTRSSRSRSRQTKILPIGS